MDKALSTEYEDQPSDPPKLLSWVDMVVHLEYHHLEVRDSVPKESWSDCELQVQQKALHRYIQGF